MQISIVIPLYNEAESLPDLLFWIKKVVNTHHLSYEIILIDDGSNDDSWNVIQQLNQKIDHVKAIRFRRNYGKSAALNEGFKIAKGDVVITMDADLQDSPDEIPMLYNMIIQDNYDLVSGWKQKRHDPITKTIPSKFFNATTRYMSGIQLNDFNCGLKAYKNKVVKTLEMYGERHRYIPLLAKWNGFQKIGEKVVQHQERKYGVSKFGLERFLNGFLDLMTIMFVGKFGTRPMHVFGLLGLICFFVGFCILIYLSVDKLIFDATKIAERPLFFFGILSAIIGMQLFLTGFIAELITRNTHKEIVYQIDETIG
jgi:glycosyltransferase involved in cell wall biosynthesis